jgi:hypothetical protein
MIKIISKDSVLGLVLIFALVLLHCSSTLPQKTLIESHGQITAFNLPETKPEYYYVSKKMLEKENVDSIGNVNYLKFRYSYFLAKQNENGLYIPTEMQTEYREAMQTGNFSQVESVTKKMMNLEYTDIKAHIMYAYALEKQNKDSKFHRMLADALIQSILSTGNGKSEETAFHVFQIEDEYAIINLFQLQLKNQVLSENDNHSFDIMTCENRDGNDIILYFDITENIAAEELKSSK